MMQYLIGPSSPVQMSLWETYSYSLVATISFVQQCSFCFSPDGTKLVLGRDKNVEMFDLTILRMENIPQVLTPSVDCGTGVDFINAALNSSDFITSVIFSNNGNTLLIKQDKNLHCADLIGMTMLWSIEVGRSCNGITFTANDTHIFFLDPPDETLENIISILDAGTGKNIFSFNTGKRAFRLILSPDQQTLAVHGLGVFLWNIDTPVNAADTRISLRAQLEGHTKYITCSEFFYDGSNRLITGSEDRTARVWDVITCAELQCIRFDHINSTTYPVGISYSRSPVNNNHRIAFDLMCKGGIEIMEIIERGGEGISVSRLTGMNVIGRTGIAYSPQPTVVLL